MLSIRNEVGSFAVKKEAIKQAEREGLRTMAENMLKHTDSSYVRVTYSRTTIFNPYACTSVIGREGKKFVIRTQESSFGIHVPCYMFTFD
ncbi:hypothetical protein L596_006111 [Steinernema carpocapsae]|uniref:Uncharacterized protein n=1 Tax=Steinernema carpocapsae TaxID=34508 RepID=A0A4U8V8B7_STECR|nr:hypothetical protein L596_006111 [Steinernema carpocapsae]